MKRFRKTAASVIAAAICLSSLPVSLISASAEWVRASGKWYYYDDEGSMVKGFVTVRGVTYYMNENGAMVTGWQTIGNRIYYFEASGAMYTGVRTIDGTEYTFGDDGALAEDDELFSTDNQGFVFHNGKTYYYSEGSRVTGWIKDSGKWYYFSRNNYEMATGFLTLNNVTYYLGETGAMASGWQTIEGNRYYFTSGGAMVTGVQTISGAEYSFGEDGILIVSEDMNDGFVEINGSKKYRIDGIFITGWVSDSGNWYYFDKTTSEMQTGFITLSGTAYYLNDEGIMVTGWQTIDGSRYYFASSGAMRKGIQTIGEQEYEFGEDGKLIEHPEIRNGFVEENGRVYFYRNDVLQTGWLRYSNKWYFLDKTTGAVQYGFIRDKGITYYLDENGEMLTGWQDIGAARYFFASDGAMYVGKQIIDGTEYEFGANGALIDTAKDGWVVSEENTYFYQNGEIQRGWKHISGKWYFFDRTYGFMYTGIQKILNDTYLFNENGEMLTGWAEYNGSTYYLYDDGRMAFGEIFVGRDNCMFGDDGKLTAKNYCGSNTSWSFENGILTITGSGEIESCASGNSPFRFISGIEKIVISDFVSKVGDYAFEGTDAQTVEFGKDVTFVSDSAFSGCTNITGVIFSNRNTEISGNPFAGNSCTISGYTGSTADIFASAYEYEFSGIADESKAVSKHILHLGNELSGFYSYDKFDIFEFTAPEEGEYLFESFSTHDTYGELYESIDLSDAVWSDDDNGGNSNFLIKANLEKNQTVYLLPRAYDVYDTINYSVKVYTKNSGIITGGYNPSVPRMCPICSYVSNGSTFHFVSIKGVAVEVCDVCYRTGAYLEAGN